MWLPQRVASTQSNRPRRRPRLPLVAFEPAAPPQRPPNGQTNQAGRKISLALCCGPVSGNRGRAPLPKTACQHPAQLDGYRQKCVWHCWLIRRRVFYGRDLRAMPQEPPSRVERRLSAILAADVAGYSRLMHNDEEATHAKLTALLTDAVAPAITEHSGRIVKNTGDGFLAEFPSAVEAVRAAMQFQTRINDLTNGDAEDMRIAFRVGINIGDVIAEPHDIFGDGVNIAARLEGIAEPGGICISSSAYDHVRGKVGVEFADLGEQNLKNIALPVRV